MVDVKLGGVNAVGRLTQAMAGVPKELQAGVRREMRPIGETVVAAARANSSWSSRIPASLTLRVRFARNPGVEVFARRAAAPHARPMEGITGRSQFRHPVFGNRDVWVAQPTRPFLRPALDGQRQQIALQLTRAIETAVARSGLR